MKILKSLKKQQIDVFFKKQHDILNGFIASTRLTDHHKKLGFEAGIGSWDLKNRVPRRKLRIV